MLSLHHATMFRLSSSDIPSRNQYRDEWKCLFCFITFLAIFWLKPGDLALSSAGETSASHLLYCGRSIFCFRWKKAQLFVGLLLPYAWVHIRGPHVLLLCRILGVLNESTFTSKLPGPNLDMFQTQRLIACFFERVQLSCSAETSLFLFLLQTLVPVSP